MTLRIKGVQNYRSVNAFCGIIPFRYSIGVGYLNCIKPIPYRNRKSIAYCRGNFDGQNLLLIIN